MPEAVFSEKMNGLRMFAGLWEWAARNNPKSQKNVFLMPGIYIQGAKTPNGYLQKYRLKKYKNTEQIFAKIPIHRIIQKLMRCQTNDTSCNQ